MNLAVILESTFHRVASTCDTPARRNRLMQLISGVDLTLTETSDRCFPLDTNLPPGIDPKQQVSLAERAGACDKPTGIRTGNCFMVIIDDRP